MSKQKVTLPQTIAAFVVLAGFMYALWWMFLGPGSEPPPHRLSAPLPGEEQMYKEMQKQATAKTQPKQPGQPQKPVPEAQSKHESK